MDPWGKISLKLGQSGPLAPSSFLPTHGRVVTIWDQYSLYTMIWENQAFNLRAQTQKKSFSFSLNSLSSDWLTCLKLISEARDMGLWLTRLHHLLTTGGMDEVITLWMLWSESRRRVVVLLRKIMLLLPEEEERDDDQTKSTDACYTCQVSLPLNSLGSESHRRENDLRKEWKIRGKDRRILLKGFSQKWKYRIRKESERFPFNSLERQRTQEECFNHPALYDSCIPYHMGQWSSRFVLQVPRALGGFLRIL